MAIPPIFRDPPESLEGITVTSPTHDVAAIPTVDLSAVRCEDPADLVRNVARAVGFFQAVNHGNCRSLLLQPEIL